MDMAGDEADYREEEESGDGGTGKIAVDAAPRPGGDEGVGRRV